MSDLLLLTLNSNMLKAFYPTGNAHRYLTGVIPVRLGICLILRKYASQFIPQ